jgi:hypothetical protein
MHTGLQIAFSMLCNLSNIKANQFHSYDINIFLKITNVHISTPTAISNIHFGKRILSIT